MELNCLLFKAKNPKGLIFYIHGNADNLRYWGDFADFFLNHNYDVFMYDFRGFGKSDGSIRGEKNLQRDAKRLYRKLLEEYDEDKIIVYGFSIGTGKIVLFWIHDSRIVAAYASVFVSVVVPEPEHVPQGSVITSPRP